MQATLLVPAPFDTVSGGYNYDRAMVEGMRAAGHDIAVAALDGAHPVCDAAAFAAARAAWAALGPDTIPVIDGLALPAFAPLADALASRRAVGLIHHPTALETGHDEATREGLRAVERDLLPRLARIVVTSTPTSERLVAEFGVDAARIAVVVPGTSDAPRSTGSGGPGCAIISVGTLVPRKGHDSLLRALARLVDLDWRLVIVGAASRDPAHAAALRDLAGTLGLADRVSFVGEVSADELERLWSASDLFALATHWEGYGMATAEALRRGLPVATTSGGAAGALVTVETGIVCAPTDEVTFSKSLRRLIFDSKLRRDMADAAWTLGCTLPDWPAQADAFARAVAG